MDMTSHTQRELLNVVCIRIPGDYGASLMDFLAGMNADIPCTLAVLTDPISDLERLAQQIQPHSPYPVQILSSTATLSHQHIHIASISQATRLIEQWQLNQLLVLITPATHTLETITASSVLQLPLPETPLDHEQLHHLLEELALTRQQTLHSHNQALMATIQTLQASNETLRNANTRLATEKTALHSLNQEYAHLYDSFESPVMVFNRDLRLVRFNIAARQRYGLGQTHPANDTIAVVLPSYLSQLEDYLQQACQTGQKQRVAVHHRGRSYHIIITPVLQQTDAVEMLVVNVIDVTETQNTRDQLDESRSRLQTIMQHTTVMIAMKDLYGRYLYANAAFLNHFNLNTDACIGKTDFQLLPESLADDIWSADQAAIQSQTLCRSTATLQVLNRSPRYFSTRHQVLKDHNGAPDMLIIEMEDITEQRQAADKLRIAAKVFQEAGEALVVTDPKANILSINRAFSRITGYTEEEAIGTHIGTLLSSGRHSQEFYANLWHTITQQGRWQGEIWNKRKNGELFPEWLTITRVLNRQGDIDYFVAVFSDISNLKESQNQVEFLATHDTLTNLPNRALFLDRLENTLARSRRSKQRFAVMFLDLDNFKSINDTLGHDTGDKLLVEVANILVSKLRDEDTVARLGGDEFTILLNNCAPCYAEEVAQRIMRSLIDPIHIDQRRIFTSVSIGLSLFPEDADDASGLLKAADTALYRSKESGRNHYSFFQNEMRETLMRQSSLESALRDALRLRQFRLVYQPKIAAETRTINGAEALLRWYEPHIGHVSPADFIPIAEKSSSIIELSHLVIDMLAQQISRWQRQGLALPVISFNVSPRCLKLEHFAAEMIQIVSKYSVSPECIQVEITESSLMGDSQHPPNNLRLLKEAGFHISIDDFGTGYSSFSHLKKLPLDELKIDKSFVNQLGQNDDDESICQAILWVSKALRLNVVAEGVETDLQAQWLIQNGCDTLQGFLYSKPLEAADFKHYLDSMSNDSNATFQPTV